MPPLVPSSYSLFFRRCILASCVEDTPLILQRRHMALQLNKKKGPKVNKRKLRLEGDGDDKREKRLGAFRPFPAERLSNGTFDFTQRPVLSLPAFSPTSVMIGKATEFPPIENDPARIYGLPKNMLLEFRLLSKPCSVIRGVTVETVELLDKARDTSSLETRLVLSGRAGCGKSFLMLQLVQHAITNDWIVIYIPRAKKLVDATTPYEYDLRTRTYLQPAFSLQTLRRIQSTNLAKLTALQTQNKLSFEKREVPVGTNLSDLIGVALKEPSLATLILEALTRELGAQTKFPVLLAVDDFQALYSRTAYRDPFFASISPFHLSVPRLIMKFASGRKSFAKGAFVGAITNSDTNYKLSLELKTALGLPQEHLVSLYDKLSPSLMEYTTGLQPLHVPDQLGVSEAAALFELWKDDNALNFSMYDDVFLSKYTESSGNARDFVWKGLLSTLEA